MDYLWRPAAHLSLDPLVYEKTMLEEWFLSRLVERVPFKR
jgi:hypothetical protein